LSIYRAVAVSRQGRQGDFLGLGNLIGRSIKSFGKLGGLLPLPGAGIIGKAAQGIGTAIQRRTKPTITPMFPSIPDLVKNFAPGMARFPAGGGGGGGMAEKWPTNKNGTPRRTRRDGKPWKRPSMNFANGRAIKRASRRLEGAEKMFRRVFSIRHGGSAGRVTPKAKGRR
jgi:hypothetical protein